MAIEGFFFRGQPGFFESQRGYQFICSLPSRFLLTDLKEMATGWDRGSVSAANYLGTNAGGLADETDSVLARKCDAFFENFRIENQFIYR